MIAKLKEPGWTLDRINAATSVWGRMLGYGSITVIGTGGTTELFHNIANPMEFRRQFQSHQP